VYDAQRSLALAILYAMYSTQASGLIAVLAMTYSIGRAACSRRKRSRCSVKTRLSRGVALDKARRRGLFVLMRSRLTRPGSP
jgi:hypothetical protein